ncbi:MAG: biotin synthase BioB [Deltaproteobacteria bacterium]|nr:MAG: biotin synthase BioB [Deltaproteobacteria bacterium]
MPSLSQNEFADIFHRDWAGMWPLMAEAQRLREHHFGRQVSFCVITNAKSGLCSEDCAFCSQAAGAGGDVPRYPLLAQEDMVEAATRAAAAGAARFSLVTSGRGVISGKEQEALLQTVAAIVDKVPIQVCASLGIVEPGFLKELKAAGASRYHHNLEAAASFFPQICTTHTYAERVATIEAAREAGLSVCAGGILGLGETIGQRWELAQALKELAVDAIPLNFLHPLPGTGLYGRPLLTPLEALQSIVAFRLHFPDRPIIICGGRQVTLRSLTPLIFAAGANCLMTGDYLTTKGRLPEEDRQMLADLDLKLV